MGPGNTMPRIALLMDFVDFYDHGITRGVIRFAKHQGDWELYGHGWMFGSVEDLSAWRGDGAIARVAERGAAAPLKALGVPVVDVAGAFPDLGFAQVTNDDERTGHSAAEYLATKGFHTFAFCGVSGVRWSDLRFAGFIAGLTSALQGGTDGASGAHPVSVPRFLFPLAQWERLLNEPRLSGFLRQLPRPAAVFAANDTVALNVLRTARSCAIAVPDELAVVGVDNEDITCELATPSLTSIGLRLEEIGYQAAAELHRLLTGGSVASHPLRLAPGRLIERESSRVFPVNDAVVRCALEIIHTPGRRGLSVGSLVDELAVSRRSLEIRFRRETGTTIHQAILQARLVHACELLRDTNDKVAVVARKAGLRSAQRLHELVRERLQMTPDEYRRLAAEEVLTVRKSLLPPAR